MNIKDELVQLSQLNAIASNEVEVSNYLKKTLKGSILSDKLGSVVARQGRGKKVLITAPMDELGMIVSQVTPSGLLKFQNVGPMPSKGALNQLFKITSKDKTFLATLIGQPHYSQSKDNQVKVDDFKSLYLDAGFISSKSVFDAGIQIGDMVTRYSPLIKLENDRYVAKALESRASVYVLSALINNLKDLNVQVSAAFTVQHKMHMKGAKTASYMIEPEIAISLDTIDSNDQVGDGSIKLGGGPVILFYDQGLIAHPKLKSYIIDLCRAQNLPYQEAHLLSGMNEGHYLQLSKHGAATVSIAIPIRNKHAHHQMIDLSDLQQTEKLLKVFIESLNDEIINNILFN